MGTRLPEISRSYQVLRYHDRRVDGYMTRFNFKKYVVFDSNPMIQKKQKTSDPQWKRSYSISISKKTFNTKKKIVKWNSIYMYQINLASSDTSYHNTVVLVYCVLTVVRSRILIVARSRASRHSHISRHISIRIRQLNRIRIYSWRVSLDRRLS